MSYVSWITNNTENSALFTSLLYLQVYENHIPISPEGYGSQSIRTISEEDSLKEETVEAKAMLKLLRSKPNTKATQLKVSGKNLGLRPLRT